MVSQEVYRQKIAEIICDDFSEMTADQLAEKLKNRFWRLNNIYYIQDEDGKKVKFRMRYIQYIFYMTMWFFNTILKSRQHGFTTLICIFMLDMCLFNSNTAAGIIAHKDEDVKTIFYKKIKFPYDNLPITLQEAIYTEKDDVHQVRFANGSSIRVGLSMRSDTLNILLISEFGKVCAKFPARAEEIVTGTIPTVHEGNFLFVESTAEGRNNTYHRWCKEDEQRSKTGVKLSKLERKFHFYPWWMKAENRTDPQYVEIPKDMIEYFADLLKKHKIKLDNWQKAWYTVTRKTQGYKMLREHPSTVEESFRGAIEGAYYAETLGNMRTAGRIRPLAHDPMAPVYTVWDLGMHDPMTIGFFQLNQAGEPKLIDCYANNQKGFSHYKQMFDEKGYNYGGHFAPHDIKVKEYSGLTRSEVAAEAGINFQDVPDIGLINGINLVLDTLGMFYIDSVKCEYLIECLESYRQDYNNILQQLDGMPLHDWASHFADMMRYAVIMFRQKAFHYRLAKAVTTNQRKGRIVTPMEIM